MPIVTLFSASYCHGDEVAERVAARLGYRVLSLDELLAECSGRHGVHADKVKKIMLKPSSVFNRWTREKERNIAVLRSTLAEMIQDEMVHHGFAGLLMPRSLSHVLRVCLVAKEEYRVEVLKGRVSGRAALRTLRKDDEAAREWTAHLFDSGPWDKRLHDVIMPMDSTTVEQAAGEICELAARPALGMTLGAGKAVQDFRLAARVGLALTERGHDERVECLDGVVAVIIDRYVVRLEAHRKELEEIASKVPGSVKVETRVGPNFDAPISYPRMDLPSKILLVDDEKEFVHTLSERLTARNLEASVAYDGEQALSMVDDDAPEVMVLDLKMPGIDGLEVLRRMKKQSPATEVIILTGHGSEAEKTLAEELGAFAYLHKPIDIEVLARTMKEAYSRVGASQKEEESSSDEEQS